MKSTTLSSEKILVAASSDALRTAHTTAEKAVGVLATECVSESCFDRFDLEIPEPPAWCAKNLHVLVPRRPNVGIGWTEEKNAICPNGRGEVRNSAVVSNQDRALKHGRQMRKRQVFCKADILICLLTFQSLSLRLVCLA